MMIAGSSDPFISTMVPVSGSSNPLIPSYNTFISSCDTFISSYDTLIPSYDTFISSYDTFISTTVPESGSSITKHKGGLLSGLTMVNAKAKSDSYIKECFTPDILLSNQKDWREFLQLHHLSEYDRKEVAKLRRAEKQKKYNKDLRKRKKGRIELIYILE